MLSRIRNNIRQSNWPILLLELLVLVIGIWGAFQLERWGKDRREARQQFIFLQQLRDETHNAIANAVYNDPKDSSDDNNRRALVWLGVEASASSAKWAGLPHGGIFGAAKSETMTVWPVREGDCTYFEFPEP